MAPRHLFWTITKYKTATGVKEHTGNIFRLWFELWFKLWFGVWLKLWPKIEESSMISLRGGGLVAAFFGARAGTQVPGPGRGRGTWGQGRAGARARTKKCSHQPSIRGDFSQHWETFLNIEKNTADYALKLSIKGILRLTRHSQHWGFSFVYCLYSWTVSSVAFLKLHFV